MISLVGAAAALRFWHLGHPAEIVFDEVHFVGQARHYIRAEPFLDPHPPIAKLLIAAGILIFGDHPASWRFANAVLGTTMVAVTYLLGRRMFGSRLAASIAGGLVAFDGFFIVESRIGCIDIVYLTFASIAYWLMFRLVGKRELIKCRSSLVVVGIVLGLVLGSKLYVPAITFLLVAGFLLLSIWLSVVPPNLAEVSLRAASRRPQFRFTAGAGLIIGSVSGMVYLASFVPHYALGWWGGIADLLHYYKDVMWYENSVATATHPYASPWWSWPFMLRPVAYWQNFPAQGKVALIWGAGNPLTWWAVVPAMVITAVRTIRQPDFARIFLVVGFIVYFLIWVPITRILFLYHYLPSLYIGYLALAAILADIWHGEAAGWESFALLLSMLPVLLIGPGHMAYEYGLVSSHGQMVVGLTLGSALLIAYLVLHSVPVRVDSFVFFAFISLASVLFIYYLPIWLAIPIDRTGYYARMWLQGPNPYNWI
jgi:dolichyl-phosphate-mannose--protein O-mannosyl transferase